MIGMGVSGIDSSVLFLHFQTAEFEYASCSNQNRHLLGGLARGNPFHVPVRLVPAARTSPRKYLPDAVSAHEPEASFGLAK